mgnify:CR=1 FL=1
MRRRGIKMTRESEYEIEKKSDITDTIRANIADLENVVRSARKLSNSVIWIKTFLRLSFLLRIIIKRDTTTRYPASEFG